MNSYIKNFKLLLIFLLAFLNLITNGQNLNRHIKSDENHYIYQIENLLKKGDKNGLYELALYFDSKKELIEKFAYNHICAYTEAHVALRILKLTTIFTESEIIPDSINSSKMFLDFLDKNFKNIHFSEYAKAFYITPLESRNVKALFREISENKQINLDKEFPNNLKKIDNKEIELLIKNKNPKVLLVLASELYKKRDFLNMINHFEKNVMEYVNILQHLTHFEIGVDGKLFRKGITWHFEEEFYSNATLNVLCYFAANYSQFKWNDKKGIFENPGIEIKSIHNEKKLFELLYSKNDYIAMDAFIKLTECDPIKVKELADEYDLLSARTNCSIPMFPFRFLIQLTKLTEYCRINNIDYIGNHILLYNVNKLKTHLTFKERRTIEDNLIQNLTLDEITALEYWSLIYSQSQTLSYSASRILDIFYSRNWNNLISNKRHLDLYLKKSVLFDQLGTHGSCNNYLMKFSMTPAQIELFQNYYSEDEDIQKQILKIKNDKKQQNAFDENKSHFNESNYDTTVTDFENQLKQLTRIKPSSYENDRKISTILSTINYDQIPLVFDLIEEFKFYRQDFKYSFMERDFGFEWIGDFNDKNTRKEFLDVHKKSTEYQLYAYYLDKEGVDYKTIENLLDYDKIYDLIKYDVVYPLTGMSKNDNEVYALIKLLEITFKTPLGFPRKLCNSDNMWACDASERANAWMMYLKNNNLLKKEHNEPVSFSVE